MTKEVVGSWFLVVLVVLVMVVEVVIVKEWWGNTGWRGKEGRRKWKKSAWW